MESSKKTPLERWYPSAGTTGLTQAEEEEPLRRTLELAVRVLVLLRARPLHVGGLACVLTCFRAWSPSTSESVTFARGGGIVAVVYVRVRPQIDR